MEPCTANGCGDLQGIPAELLQALLDNSYESLILVDAEGIVRYMSPANDGIYPVPVREAIGRHISEVSPNTRLPRVIETGKAEIGRGLMIQGKPRVIARIPLVSNGRIVGAAGKLMFMNPEKLKELYERIDTLKHRLDFYREEFQQVYGYRYSVENLIGDSPVFQQAKSLAVQAAASNAPVLIVGESGTGKELFAHAIHQISRRRSHHFVRVNCAAIPADLLESELFGYEPGSFTGAHKHGKPGKFELAHQGTIFLDEIGDMPPMMQVKLMRVLQEKEVERIGGKPKAIDFRVISATNRDLEAMIREKSFRLDLFYRLNVIVIRLPALREMKEDIPLIFNHFIDQLCRESRRKPIGVSAEVMEALERYDWPGNVRELRNLAERVMIVCAGDRIDLDHLPMPLRARFQAAECFPDSADPDPDAKGRGLKAQLEAAERRAVIDALRASGGNRTLAARQLGIHRTGLYQKMQKYGVR
ncbi:sigma-54 interaction domain-containing protein [Desulfatirhabdium butyrativorans]|uniref:sigma-54 interaction domain-containing protein n=1 Tax=Desulfatirhabdium butyrativorans TaxID=340467 RepID=UPI000550EAA5|nr:sigma 54-interacting transcriptional regulator [Desulfatirhabdium butyrativorans]